MLHSLAIWLATATKRHPGIYAELPTGLKQPECVFLPVKLLLVIPAMPEHFLHDATDKLRKAFQIDRKLWSIASGSRPARQCYRFDGLTCSVAFSDGKISILGGRFFPGWGCSGPPLYGRHGTVMACIHN